MNSYGGLPTLHGRMALWKRPYLVTEWAFGAPGTGPEPSGREKAAVVAENWRRHVRLRALGSYFFHWSRSGADLSGWFSAFLKSGERTPVVDAMTRAWGGRLTILCPAIKFLKGPAKVAPGGELTLSDRWSDPERDTVKATYTVLSDDPKTRFVGDFERSSGGGIEVPTGREIRLREPKTPGGYRLVLVVRDGSGSADAATHPFRVE